MQVEIVSPEAILFDGEADMVIARGTAGEFGVLADHEPMVAALGYGELRLYNADTVSHRFAVFGGFLEIRNNVVSVLTDNAVSAGAIDLAAAQADLAALTAQSGKDEDEAHADKIKRAEVMVKIGEG